VDFLKDYSEFAVDSPLRPKTAVSPELRSIKRSRLGRANSTASVLADISSKRLNRQALDLNNAPALSPVKLGSPVRIFTPTKREIAPASPLLARLSHVSDPFLDVPGLWLQQTLVEATVDGGDIEEPIDFKYALNLPSDDSEAGVDILQGFKRIGAATQPSLASQLEQDSASSYPGAEQSSRSHPPFSRSYTSLF